MEIDLIKLQCQESGNTESSLFRLLQKNIAEIKQIYLNFCRK